MAAGLVAFDDDRVGAHAHELAGEAECGGETEHSRPALFDPVDGCPARQTAGEDDVADAMAGANIDQFRQSRMHRDQVDAERAAGQRLGRGDLRGEELRRHRAGGDHPEPAGGGNGGDEVALRHPGHRAAHDRQFAAEKLASPPPQPIEFGAKTIARPTGCFRVALRALLGLGGAGVWGHSAASRP